MARLRHRPAVRGDIVHHRKESTINDEAIALISARRAAREPITARLNYRETAHEHGENTRAAGAARDACDAAFSRLVPGDDEQAGALVDSLASIAASLCGYFRQAGQGVHPRCAREKLAERDAAHETRLERAS
jgi:hypothetical protein